MCWRLRRTLFVSCEGGIFWSMSVFRLRSVVYVSEEDVNTMEWVNILIHRRGQREQRQQLSTSGGHRWHECVHMTDGSDARVCTPLRVRVVPWSASLINNNCK